MRRLLALAPVLAALVACSTSTDEGAVSEDALVTGSVCSSLDYGPRPATPADLYKFYPNNDAVAADIQQLISGGILAQFVGGQATLQGVDTNERATRLVREVYEGFKKAFPVETAGIPQAPPVVILNTPQVNAFAMGNSLENGALNGKSPWFFVVLSGLLAHGNTDDELRGVFAHEIGHLVLQTFRPDVQARVRHAYTLGETSENGVLGEAQADDAAISPKVGRILLGHSRNGAIAHLGLNVLAPGVYLRLLQNFLQPSAATQAVCTSAQQKMGALAQKQQQFLPGVAEQNLVPRIPNATEQAELDRLSNAAIADLKACAAPNAQVAPLSVISALLQGLSPAAAFDPSDPAYAQIQAGMHPIEQQIDQQMPTATLNDRLFAAEAAVRKDIVTLRSDPALNVSRVRVYDFEEDADDASMRVLHAIGHDAMGVGGFIISLLPAAAKAKCIADVAAGKPIGFGEFYDVHPTSCWRYYHAQQFSKALGLCDFVSPSFPFDKRAPLQTSMPFIANDPAAVSGIPQR